MLKFFFLSFFSFLFFFFFFIVGVLNDRLLANFIYGNILSKILNMIHVRICKKSEYAWSGFNSFRILQIFYRCSDDREYELFLGGGYRNSVSDTCDHGQWVKKVKPMCKESKFKSGQISLRKHAHVIHRFFLKTYFHVY